MHILGKLILHDGTVPYHISLVSRKHKHLGYRGEIDPGQYFVSTKVAHETKITHGIIHYVQSFLHHTIITFIQRKPYDKA